MREHCFRVCTVQSLVNLRVDVICYFDFINVAQLVVIYEWRKLGNNCIISRPEKKSGSFYSGYRWLDVLVMLVLKNFITW